MRIARGAGRPPGEVVELFEEYKRMRTAIVGAKGQGGLMKAMGKSMNARGGPSAAQMAQMQAHMGKMLPPHVLLREVCCVGCRCLPRVAVLLQERERAHLALKGSAAHARADLRAAA